MDTSIIHALKTYWPNWNIGSLLGKGTQGSVYKITKIENDYTYESALKIITLDKSSFHNKNNLDDYLTNEIRTLYKLKGYSSIINYEDHIIVNIPEENFVHILIRMEYLNTFKNYLGSRAFSINELVNMSLDICSALSLCHKQNIIHRDVKESNIFVNVNNTFKLGDFGISKLVQNSSLEYTSIGTPMYVAPEVLSDSTYDERADIYSLAMLIYKFLNNGKYPFEYDENSGNSQQKAFLTRVSGKEIPPPYTNNKFLTKIILKALSFKKESRHSNIDEFKKDLILCLNKIEPQFKNLNINHEFIDINNSNELTRTMHLSNTCILNESDSLNVISPNIESNNININLVQSTLEAITYGEGNLENQGLICNYNNSIIVSLLDNTLSTILYFENERIIEKLFDFPIKNIAMIQDKLIFIHPLNNSNLYSYCFKTNILQCVIDSFIDYFVWDEYNIYFINKNSKNNLFKFYYKDALASNISISTQNSIAKLNSYSCDMLCIYFDKIFFINSLDNHTVYCHDISKNICFQVIHTKTIFICVSKDFIYYINSDDNQHIYTYNILKNSIEKLIDVSVSSINPYKNHLYCIDNYKSCIYKIDEKCKSCNIIYNGYGDNIQIINDKLIFTDNIIFEKTLCIDLITHKINTFTDMESFKCIIDRTHIYFD